MVFYFEIYSFEDQLIYLKKKQPYVNPLFVYLKIPFVVKLSNGRMEKRF